MSLFQDRSRWQMALPVSALLLCVAQFALLLVDRGELTRVRNSLEYDVAPESQFAWVPDRRPADFRWEDRAISPELRARAADVLAEAAATQGDLPRALTIIRHLTAVQGDGEPIMSSLLKAYNGIVDHTGYCSDFTTVFEALALTSGLQVREWGFGIDGFDIGHAFSEVYDRELGQWVFLDVFNSFYARERVTGKPISVLELRAKLLRGDVDELEIVPITPQGFRFQHVDRAFEYYRQGADQMYMWWSNAVISYDASPVVRFAAHFGRAAERVAAIVTGVHSRLRVVESDSNRVFIERLSRAKYEFLGIALIVLVVLIDLMLRVRAQTARRAGG